MRVYVIRRRVKADIKTLTSRYVDSLDSGALLVSGANKLSFYERLPESIVHVMLSDAPLELE